MKKIFFLALLLTSLHSFSQNLHHNLSVTLDIANSEINAIDSMKITRTNLENKDYIQFKLNSNLTIESLDKNFVIKKVSISTDEASVRVNSYKISLKGKENAVIIPLHYKGIINDQIKEGAAEYARGFSTTTGIIFENGVFLSGSTYWIPSVENNILFTFDLTVTLPEQWNLVSQGKRVVNEVKADKRIVKYNSPDFMDEIYLIANNWTEYSLQSDNVLVQVFLRTPDENLANRYLLVTNKYIKLYEDLIDPYPFTKFALIENFWETGFGMPSFTLLGEKVIRFPWILNSSYPHELLHNYWGNSVFVDYDQGNWCEGITAYMADHLIKEQSGEAADYRRNTLQKFTDYVNPENDFPISKFISRNNSAQEAIGYGKCLMFNDMLRENVGDELFLKAYSEFYKNNKFKLASFGDIRGSFENVSGKDLSLFFNQWLTRTGAPKLKLTDVNLLELKNLYNLSFKISQVQTEEVFKLDIPVVVYLEGEDNVIHEKINISKRETVFTLKYDKRPLRIDIDPQFNIFRRLDQKEVSPSLSQVFGAKKSAIILPGNSIHFEAYKSLAEMWQKTQSAQEKTLDIIIDSDIESLPSENALWILGFENKFAKQINITKNYNTFLSEEVLNKMDILKKEGSLIFTISNPINSNETVGFVGANSDKAISALTRKLTHYGKYGYLGFKGEKATNNLKGSLPALHSPLNYIISYKGDSPMIKATIKPRKALSQK